MTKLHYSQDCVAPFKVQGQALSSSPVANNSNNAWIVNFNNGNDNNNNKNNNNYVRLVRSGECLPVVKSPSVCFYKAMTNANVTPNSFVIPNVVRNLKAIATRDVSCLSMTKE